MLNELNLSYELVKVDSSTYKTVSGEDYLAINPNSYVPALECEEGIITEVPSILQYLQNKYQPEGFKPPSSPYDLSKTQSLLNFLSSELHKAFVPYWYQPNKTEEQEAEAFKKLGRRMNYMEQLLSGENEYLLGDEISVADLYAFVVISWCGFHDIDITQWPNIAIYMGRLSLRKAIIKTIQLESD